MSHKIEKKKTIGGMISDLEDKTEAYRKAELIVYNWQFILKMANPNQKYELMQKMLREMEFSEEEINKILKRN